VNDPEIKLNGQHQIAQPGENMKKLALILLFVPWMAFAAEHAGNAAKSKEHAGDAAKSKEHAGDAAKSKEHAGDAAKSKK
jgi:hypothetical protein